jgi:hypothetical protein
MSKQAPLTEEEEQTVRASGSVWCSEETFAKLFATLDATRDDLRKAAVDRNLLAMALDLSTKKLDDVAATMELQEIVKRNKELLAHVREVVRG